MPGSFATSPGSSEDELGLNRAEVEKEEETEFRNL